MALKEKINDFSKSVERLKEAWEKANRYKNNEDYPLIGKVLRIILEKV